MRGAPAAPESTLLVQTSDTLVMHDQVTMTTDRSCWRLCVRVQIRDKLWSKTGRAGVNSWKICYNPKKHGRGSSVMIGRCKNRGPLFLIMRRRKNGRVFGGFMHKSLEDKRGYHYSSSKGPFLYVRAKPSLLHSATLLHSCRAGPLGAPDVWSLGAF